MRSQGNLMKFPAGNFCIWPRALPRCRPCHGSLGRRPIPRGRCASSSALRLAAPPTSSRVLSVSGSRKRLGQSFVIENRPGAAGNVAAEAVVKSVADGYVLLMGGANNAINTTLYDKLNFNFLRDITPVASVIREPLIMEVNPSVPAKDRFRVHCLHQGQPRQDQHGVRRYRFHKSSFR